MTPLADRSTGEQWPELEPCACGQSALTQETPRNYRAYCDSIPGKLVCMREVFGKSKAEAAAAWNAMQIIARGGKVDWYAPGLGMEIGAKQDREEDSQDCAEEARAWKAGGGGDFS